jgi:hypothetical protein
MAGPADRLCRAERSDGPLADGYKFFLNQRVEYPPSQGMFSRGVYVVTTKLSKRDREFE